MSTLTNYNGLQVITPVPPGPGGNAINKNFKALSTFVSTIDPTTGNDGTQGFVIGSRWYNSSTTNEWICLDNSAGAANWAAITSSSLATYLPLAGGTMTGTLDMGTQDITNGGNINNGPSHLVITGGLTIQNNGQIVDETSENTIYQAGNFNANAFHGVTFDGGGSSFTLGGGSGFVQLGQAFNAKGYNISLNDASGSGGGTLNMDGGTLNMGNGGGTGGGNLNIDGGIITALSQVLFTDSTLQTTAFLGLAGSATGTINMVGETFNMNDGSGSGGGTLNMDGGTIAFDGTSSLSTDGAGNLTFTATSVSGLPSPPLAGNASGTINMAGNILNMNLGGGTGGGNLNMDRGVIAFGSGADADWLVWSDGENLIVRSADATAQVEFVDAATDLIYLNMNANTLNMNDASGAGGGTLNMEGGQIVQMRAENNSAAPSSPNPGQIYFDTTTNHFYGWDGSAWKQLDN